MDTKVRQHQMTNSQFEALHPYCAHSKAAGGVFSKLLDQSCRKGLFSLPSTAGILCVFHLSSREACARRAVRGEVADQLDAICQRVEQKAPSTGAVAERMFLPTRLKTVPLDATRFSEDKRNKGWKKTSTCLTGHKAQANPPCNILCEFPFLEAYSHLA